MRSNMVTVVCVLLLATAPGIGAMDTGPLVREDAAAAEVLKQNYILVEAEGGLDVPFDEAVSMFNREQLLGDVQAAYAEMLPEGERPEFVIEQTAPRTYEYVNADDETSMVKEVCRQVDPSGSATVVYYTAGRRFFGQFESLVHIEIGASDADPSAYRVAVYAYPHNGLSRFLARHLNLVERYFNRKTESMVDLVTRISRHLCEDAKLGEPELSGDPAPAKHSDPGPAAESIL